MNKSLIPHRKKFVVRTLHEMQLGLIKTNNGMDGHYTARKKQQKCLKFLIGMSE